MRRAVACSSLAADDEPVVSMPTSSAEYATPFLNAVMAWPRERPFASVATGVALALQLEHIGPRSVVLAVRCRWRVEDGFETVVPRRVSARRGGGCIASWAIGPVRHGHADNLPLAAMNTREQHCGRDPHHRSLHCSPAPLAVGDGALRPCERSRVFALSLLRCPRGVSRLCAPSFRQECDGQ